MSWGFSAKFKDGVPVDEENALEQIKRIKDSSVEHFEQFLNSVTAVDLLIGNGAFGDPDGLYQVTLSGHGNPGHKPAAGWTNDSLSLTIYQLES